MGQIFQTETNKATKTLNLLIEIGSLKRYFQDITSKKMENTYSFSSSHGTLCRIDHALKVQNKCK